MASNYEQEIVRKYQQRQRQVIDEQRIAAARADAREQAAAAAEDNQNIFQKGVSLLGEWLDNAWTDDFSAIPVIGPAAAKTGEYYTQSTEGISGLLSAGALAANPNYWANREQGADIMSDAFRVQPGRAITALGSYEPLAGVGLSAENLPDGFGGANIDVYGKDANFNIADDMQRDRMFSDPTLAVTSGIVDGLATWFLDPLVIGGKGVKIARFGTTAMGLDRVPGVGRLTTGLTNRTLLDQRGYNKSVFKAVEAEADEALAFAEGRGGVETPIGVLGERIARGDFEDLLELDAFQGQARDLLAAAGSSLKTKEDGIIFVAAAAGSTKYQAMLRDRATAVYAGLQQTVGRYEQRLLNTPIGAEQKPILSEPLSKDFSVGQLLNDLRKRDPDLDAALADVALEAERAQGVMKAAGHVPTRRATGQQPRSVSLPATTTARLRLSPRPCIRRQGFSRRFVSGIGFAATRLLDSSIFKE